MFRENKDHKQIELFDTISEMPRRVQHRLERSWASSFYENIFCNIDEQAFACLYSEDVGRPNFPVNILVAFEVLKHTHDLSDEAALDQFYFNMLWRVAMGTRNIGQDSFAERTLYDFRERLYRHALENPGNSDLIHLQFDQISKHLMRVMGLDDSEMRTDSSQIMPNISKAGRLSLSYDVLTQALRDYPKELLPEELITTLSPDFKQNLLYRTKNREVDSRFKEMLLLCLRFVELMASTPQVQESSSSALVKRFLEEHADIDQDTKELEVRSSKQTDSNSLQSAYDPDATNRTKGRHNYSGYAVNLFETCADSNPVQMLTDYTLEKNNVADTTMVKNRLGKVKERHGLKDLYLDGGYYGEDVLDEAKDKKVKMHFTDMTGRESSKIPVTRFLVEDNRIKQCPAGQDAAFSYIDKKSGTLSARFDPKVCRNCEHKSNCPMTLGKKEVIVRITRKQLKAAQTRDELSNKGQRIINTSKRAAIEGTNSVLKRAYGAGKLTVRGLNKCRVVIGLKMLAYNISQFHRWHKGEYRRYPKRKTTLLGLSVAPAPA